MKHYLRHFRDVGHFHDIHAIMTFPTFTSGSADPEGRYAEKRNAM